MASTYRTSRFTSITFTIIVIIMTGLQSIFIPVSPTSRVYFLKVFLSDSPSPCFLTTITVQAWHIERINWPCNDRIFSVIGEACLFFALFECGVLKLIVQCQYFLSNCTWQTNSNSTLYKIN
jgi:hypothetical protein